jgi:hypothetical protein
MKNVPFDKYDFIWKKYSQHGHRTLYSEDAPGSSKAHLSSTFVLVGTKENTFV